jgi:SAM-dependent methyltransferase
MPELTPEQKMILEMANRFRASCVLGAAAEVDLFTVLGDRQMDLEEIARRLNSDPRATRILLDAAAAQGLLSKQGSLYSVPAGLRPLLSADSPRTLLPMIWHLMNVMRNWAQLASVVKSGEPNPRQPSIRGEEADRAAFIAAMHSISGPFADEVIAKLKPIEFRHALDVGGASGTWTMALLRAVPGARATIFDLPDAVAQARERIGRSEFASRVDFAPGDFYVDELPPGVDFAWVSAIVHQHSRSHNRDLYAKVFRALVPGGRIGIRDFVMDATRTRPADGALFAINMLVNTATGDTFTLDEYTEDLQSAGFVDVELKVASEDMNSVVLARKP